MTDIPWDAMKVAAELIAAFVAVATFVHGVLEYRRKNALERFNKFQEMRERWNSRDFNEITDSSYSLGKVDISIKYKFMAFLEEIALMINSGILQDRLVFYYWGYDILRILNDPEFFDDSRRLDDPNWSVLKELFDAMKTHNNKPRPPATTLHF